jgi:hypothetical protein
MYMQDHDGRLLRAEIVLPAPLNIWRPPWWDQQLLPYVKNQSVFVCPSDGQIYGSGRDTRSIGINANILGSIASDADVQKPATTLLYFENTGLGVGESASPGPNLFGTSRFSIERGRNAFAQANTCRQHHVGGCNLVLYDGHAKWYRKDPPRGRADAVKGVCWLVDCSDEIR